jgi:hypothetical protein
LQPVFHHRVEDRALLEHRSVTTVGDEHQLSLGISTAKRSATSGGVIRSSLPHTTSVGAAIWPSRLSRFDRLAERATCRMRRASGRVVSVRRTASIHAGVTSAVS